MFASILAFTLSTTQYNQPFIDEQQVRWRVLTAAWNQGVFREQAVAANAFAHPVRVHESASLIAMRRIQCHQNISRHTATHGVGDERERR